MRKLWRVFVDDVPFAASLLGWCSVVPPLLAALGVAAELGAVLLALGVGLILLAGVMLTARRQAALSAASTVRGLGIKTSATPSPPR